MVFLDQSKKQIDFKLSKCPSTPIIKNLSLLEDPPELNLTSRKLKPHKKRNFSFSVQKNCFEGKNANKLVDLKKLVKQIKSKQNMDFKRSQFDLKLYFPSTKSKTVIDIRKKKKPLIKHF